MAKKFSKPVFRSIMEVVPVGKRDRALETIFKRKR